MKEQSKGKIKIAFVSSNAWTMYNFRREVILSLLHNGMDVIIIAEDDDYTGKLIAMGCLFVPVSVKNRSLRPLDDIFLFLKLKKVYRQHRPDFIFHYIIKPNIYGTLAAGMLKIPSIAIITGLGHAFNKHNLLSAFIKLLYRFSLQYAQQVWCLNEDDANFFLKNKIISFRKIKVLPGEGVNSGEFSRSMSPATGENGFTFLMSARLLKSKGIIEYARATRLLQQKGLVFRSLLMGAFESHPDAISKGEVDSWQQEGSLAYLGFTDDVKAQLEKADCFVYPSYYNEGVPRSLMEACSMQIPVITTDNTGCRNLVRNGINGYICKKQDPFSLAIKMEKMMSVSEPERLAMGKKGREIIEKSFGVNKVIEFYWQLLSNYFNP